jgi:hypothetical protein
MVNDIWDAVNSVADICQAFSLLRHQVAVLSNVLSIIWAAFAWISIYSTGTISMEMTHGHYSALHRTV